MSGVALSTVPRRARDQPKSRRAAPFPLSSRCLSARVSKPLRDLNRISHYGEFLDGRSEQRTSARRLTRQCVTVPPECSIRSTPPEQRLPVLRLEVQDLGAIGYDSFVSAKAHRSEIIVLQASSTMLAEDSLVRRVVLETHEGSICASGHEREGQKGSDVVILGRFPHVGLGAQVSL